MKIIFTNPETGQDVETIEISENPTREEKSELRGKIKEYTDKGFPYRYEGEE